VIPFDEYERLVEDLEMLQDIRAYDEAKKAIDEGEELIPSAVTYAILDGENPIRVWREYLGLTQQELAEAAGISIPYLSQIETGKRRGTTEVLATVAKALGLSLDDVVVTEPA
jgi:DNA-binding XRE family transcriptional regulator